METTIYFWIGFCLGNIIGGVLGFAVCAVLTVGGDSEIDDWEDE